MSKGRVLLVDDDAHIIQLVRANLQVEGYEIMVARDGAQGLATVEQEAPDLVILDVVMPEMDGTEVTRRIREFSAVPVILLTARSSEADIVRGFDAGADDYLTKPFSVNELLVRVRAVLRRSKYADEIIRREPLRIGEIEVDFSQHRVIVRDKEIALTPIEYRLFAHLAANVGRVMLHQDLLQHVWGPEYREETEYLRVYIRYLRLKIEEIPSKPRYILTKSGAGYMLRAPQEPQDSPN
jgi:DNA-binding response OmpR family regulator